MDRLPRLLVLLAAAAGAATAVEPGAIGSAAELAAFLGGGGPGVRAFDVTGRVSFAETGSFVLSGGGARVHAGWPGDPPPRGALVRAEGTAGVPRGDPAVPFLMRGEPYATAAAVEVLSRDEPPPPERVALAGIDPDRHDLAYLETEGEVTDAGPDEMDERFAVLVLSDGDRTLPVFVLARPGFDPGSLVGARVEARGLFWKNLSGVRKFAGPVLAATSADGVRVVAPPPDPFAAPEAESLRYASPSDVRRAGRRTVRGIVVASWGRNRTLLRTADGRTILAELSGGAPPPPAGAWVAVSGLLQTDAFQMRLARASFREEPPPAELPPEPAPVPLSEVVRRTGGRVAYNALLAGCPVFSKGDAAHAGTFMRPERVAMNRKMGQLYRFTSRQSADTISAGAVTEALANDLTRIAGVPSQELEIVRGQYSDGHPKIMLAAKFADGYKDLEAGMLKDGRVVKPKGAPKSLQMESLGKYKAFFLVTADRDGIGKRGQNKGFVGGKFFAIDPGHSLEGNGKYLKISDDLSFKDTYGKSSKPRFNNFSVFDDDTFFSKMEGVVNLRQRAEAGEFKKVFDDYRAAFDPKEKGISDAEKALRTKICADIDKKEAEFNESLKKILDVSANNLNLYDDLAEDGPAIQQGAIETVANLEKLTSPTTWVSKKGQVALNHLEVLPESRVPWKAALKGDNIVYYCETKMSFETTDVLEGIAKSAGAIFERDALGFCRLVVPKDRAEQVFAAFSEENVQRITHPEEFIARHEGGDGLKAAKTYKPVPYAPPKPDPRPLLDPKTLPDFIDVPARYFGATYSIKFPRIHCVGLLSARSSVHRPRNIGELRYLIESQINRGNEVLGALMSGKTHLFEPTRENIVALTYALHATALKKGEFMYRGSFSIEDRNGEIARWLDKANDLYIRTSTHAKPYQSARVDGHLNMPRGYDVPTGAGGLLNGMRTFHFFTIPDSDGLKNGGNGNGPRRRLFLKCETFGIFCSTAHLRIFSKPASVVEGMKTRGYRFGDILESIAHGSSLFVSLFTPKEAPGIRKENLTKVQKEAIQWAQNKLRTKYPQLAERLTAGNVLDGAGLNRMIDNMAWILDHMPEDEDERAWITDVLDYMSAPLEGNFGNEKYGDVGNRIGNEIMIGEKDLR